MTSTLERQRLQWALLRELIDIDPNERAAWIAAHSAGDTELAEQLQALVETSVDDVFERGLDVLAAALVDDTESINLPSGTLVGAWQVERVIGHGGMGTVYLAHRDGEGFRQHGALKLIKRGMDSAAVLARFRRERHILARLDHPHIARLLDGGAGPDGQPYFVMEFVEGQTLRNWLDITNPDLSRRLAVFLEVGDAISHAHRHLVVHCDIKPENVLVTSEGHARLLDFGIARLLGEDDNGRTATLQRFVSRACAAPEQLAGDAVSTATDVYQLGVLLHELLTNHRDGVPSTTRHDGQCQSATTRPRLRGDAAVIVARATDDEPARRYATAAAVCADVRAWRAGLPIAARPDSASYRIRRLIARHRIASVALLVALCAIFSGAGLALWQAHEARLQARHASAEAASAKALQDFMLRVFTQAEPWRNAGHQPTALDLARTALGRVEIELAGQPDARAEMYLALSRLFSVAGDLHQSTEAAARAITALEQLQPPDPPRLFAARLRLAAAYLYTIDFDRAEAQLDRLEHDPLATEPKRALSLLGLRADLARDRGRPAAARRLSEQALAFATHYVPEHRAERAWHLAQAERTLGHYPAARHALDQARALRETASPPSLAMLNHTVLSAWSLAAEIDAPAQALEPLARACMRSQQIFGPGVMTARALRTYGEALNRVERPTQAVGVLREAVRQAEQGTGGSAYDAAAPRVALATSLIDLGHQDEARTLLAAADAAWSRVADPDDPRRWVLRLVAARAATDAPAALHAAWVKNTPSEAQTKPKAMIWLAEAEAHAGRTSEARRWWLDALDALGRQGRPSSALAWRALHGLGMPGDPRARQRLPSRTRPVWASGPANRRLPSSNDQSPETQGLRRSGPPRSGGGRRHTDHSDYPHLA
ncbi:MAG TPA: serine/threonine-protein kinase [Chiayiivirga sp.]|nr:serine/threonine-protein kinase [Chiayiivirga sp.]